MFAGEIASAINESAASRGVQMPARTRKYILEKMQNGLGVIALHPESGEWMGFSYIEVWEHKKYVANSGLIVPDKFRGMGVAREIKMKVFELSLIRFPHARMFSLTANPTVIKVNLELGFRLVPFDEMLVDECFLTGCSCHVDYASMMSAPEKHLCHVAMVFDPTPGTNEIHQKVTEDHGWEVSYAGSAVW